MLSVDDELAVLGKDLAIKATVNRVEFKHVDLTWFSFTAETRIAVTYHVIEINKRTVMDGIS